MKINSALLAKGLTAQIGEMKTKVAAMEAAPQSVPQPLQQQSLFDTPLQEAAIKPVSRNLPDVSVPESVSTQGVVKAEPLTAPIKAKTPKAKILAEKIVTK